jgi:hypothetical protein
MFARLAPQEIHPRTAARKPAARLRLVATAVATVICGALAWAAAPAASAAIIPIPDGPYGPAAPPAVTVRVVNTGGMAGWQIILIAIGAAVVAAVAAVLLDRTLAARRATSATTA